MSTHYMLSMAAFTLDQEGQVAAAKTLQPAKSKNLYRDSLLTPALVGQNSSLKVARFLIIRLWRLQTSRMSLSGGYFT